MPAPDLLVLPVAFGVGHDWPALCVWGDAHVGKAVGTSVQNLLLLEPFLPLRVDILQAGKKIKINGLLSSTPRNDHPHHSMPGHTEIIFLG